MPLNEFLEQFNQKAAARRKEKPIPRGYDAYSSSPHLFSNQPGFQLVLSQLAHMQSLKIFGKTNIAIILGEGYFLSSLPELSKHVGTIIFIDIDERVIEHNLYMLECFRKAKNPREFGELILSADNPILKKKLSLPNYVEVRASQPDKVQVINNKTTILNADILLKSLRAGVATLDKEYFLMSVERYEQCKRALQNLTFYALNADVLDEQLMKEFGEQLISNNASVRIVNITNLFDYEGNYPVRERPNKKIDWQPNDNVEKALAAIIDRPDEATILYSVTDIERNFDRLVADIACSLTEYKALTSQYATMINMCHKYPKCRVGIWSNYADRFKLNVRTSANYLFFSYNLNPAMPWLDNLKQFMHCRDGLFFLRNSPRGLIDVLIKIHPDFEGSLVAILEKYQIAFQKRHMSIIVVDIQDSNQKNKIMLMINAEKSLIDYPSPKISENIESGGSGRKIYK